MISLLSMPSKVDRRDAEVRVAELALDDVEWDALASHFDGVRVAELCQAIAKAETVRGDAPRLGRSVHLCLCNTPVQDGLAALLLLVRGGTTEPTGDALAPTPMRASCGVPVVADRAVHRAGLTGHATTSGRERGDLQAQRLQGFPLRDDLGLDECFHVEKR
jgi:hypothetical protein